jgi:hypothetical protein
MYVDELNQVRDNNGNILYPNGTHEYDTITTTGTGGTGTATGIWDNGTSGSLTTKSIYKDGRGWITSVDDDTTNILQSLLIIGKMLKYFKENIQDDTMLKMIKEYEDFTDPYAIDEETIKEIEDLYKL